MNIRYFHYLTNVEKLLFFLNILAFLGLVSIFIKTDFAFGIDTGLILLAILKTHITLIQLGMQRIPIKQHDEKIRAFIQQAERFPWLYKRGGINGALLAWGIAIAWLTFASALFNFLLTS